MKIVTSIPAGMGITEHYDENGQYLGYSMDDGMGGTVDVGADGQTKGYGVRMDGVVDHFDLNGKCIAQTFTDADLSTTTFSTDGQFIGFGSAPQPDPFGDDGDGGWDGPDFSDRDF